MVVAIWIIAVCEVIRALQNVMQLIMYWNDKGQRDNAYQAFIYSLKDSDRDMVKKLLMEIDKKESV